LIFHYLSQKTGEKIGKKESAAFQNKKTKARATLSNRQKINFERSF